SGHLQIQQDIEIAGLFKGAGLSLHPFFFSGSLDLSHGILPRTPSYLSFRGAERRGICCSPTLGQEQISRFARNDKGWGLLKPAWKLNLLVFWRSPWRRDVC